MAWPDLQLGQADSCLGLTRQRVGGAMPHRFGLRARTAVLTSALIFVGFWLTGVLSQSPYFGSYSNQVTLHTLRQRPSSVLSQGCGGGYTEFILTPLLCKQWHVGENRGH